MIYKNNKKIKEIKNIIFIYIKISVVILHVSLYGMVIAIINCIMVGVQIFMLNKNDRYKSNTYWHAKDDAITNDIIQLFCSKTIHF